MATKAEKQTELTPRAYIGPTIPGLVSQGTVFRNGLPELFREQAEIVPELNALLTPLARFARAWRDAHTPGTAEHTLYAEAAQKLSEQREREARDALAGYRTKEIEEVWRHG